MMAFPLADDTRPRLTGPIRLDVFATIERRTRRKTVAVGVAWQGWNLDARMETAMVRLSGAGSFYWPGAIMALAAARAMFRADARIHQIKLESISGCEVGRCYRRIA